ncbi:MAG: rRNA maturation RNase YbeY [Treponemataceae bacterium]
MIKSKKFKNNITVTDEYPNSSIDSQKIILFIQAILEELQKKDWEISIVFCNDDFICQLNNDYRQKDEPTDVLSFVQGDYYTDENNQQWFCAGDIIISLDSLKKNAQYFGVPIQEELQRLLIHGILHLDGLDHSDNNPLQPMLILQEEILSKIKNDNTLIK